jgi:hypothetical protein
MGTRAITEPADAGAAWAVAVRVAGVTAVVTAVFGLALQRFMGLGTAPLMVLATAVALLVGFRLPAAAPAFLQPIELVDADLDDDRR